MLLVLLDANAIIALHMFGAWEQIKNKHDVHIPSIVLRSEVFWYETPDKARHAINLLSEDGITEVDCTPEEIENFALRYSFCFLPENHKGEQEALALLEAQEKFIFCTFDGAALTVLGFMGLAERGLSLEGLLRASGSPRNWRESILRLFLMNMSR